MRRRYGYLGLAPTFWLMAMVIPLSPVAAQDTAPETRVPSAALAHADDYTFGYYPYGWRRPNNEGPIRFAVQTNRYALLLDASKACVERLGPIAAPLPPLDAVLQGNSLLKSLPEAALTFAVEWNGRPFPAAQGAGSADQVRLYHVGKYLQHFTVQPVQFGGGAAGPGLEGVQGWLESYCWTGRMAWLLHVDSYENHLMPPQQLNNVVLSASLQMPPEYPIVEMLDDTGAWTPAAPDTVSERAILMRNDAGQGIALVTAPGTGQRVLLSKENRLKLESERSDLPVDRSRTLPCIVVPSADIRREAAREAAQSQADAEVSAEGIAPYTGALPVDFDSVKGWYQITLGENADLNVMERVRLTLRNPAPEPRTVRLNFAKVGGGFPITGLSPVLRTAEGCPLGLPVQISKNWHCAPPWFHGLVPLDLESGQQLAFEFDLAYARWGGVPAVSHAQLCLVGYGGNQLWDEMAIGSFGESICYDPDVNLNRSMIDDMRPLMVWGMGAKPKIQWSWTHNVGGCDFLLLLKKSEPQRQFLTRMKTLYQSYGPVLSDVTYAGQTRDGSIQARMRTQSWRSDDYVRALYTLRYEIAKPVDNIDRLAFFQLGADHYHGLQFKRIARGSLAGLDEAWEPPAGGLEYSRRGEPLPGNMPWIGLYEVQKTPPEAFPKDDQGALADKAMIVRAWKARLGGQDCPLPHYSVFGSHDGVPSALVELSPPPDLPQLEPGDFVEAQVEVLVLPQRAEDYYGPNENLIQALRDQSDPWELTLREATGSNVEVSATAGTVEQAWPVRIRAGHGTHAAFTINGGLGYTPVTITGVASPSSFILQEVLGEDHRETIDQSSEIGNDWWQSDFHPDTGTWDLTFTLPLETPENTRQPHVFEWSATPPPQDRP